jgi:lysine 2,3-aminomutase
MEYLRGRLSGLAIPLFVVDAPYGGGKIPVLPNYVVSVSPTHTVLRNFEGMLVTYPEPSGSDDRPPPRTGEPASTGGVWELATGQASKIEPENSVRKERRRVPANRRPGKPFASQ